MRSQNLVPVVNSSRSSQSRWLFLREFFRSPVSIGAVTPSSDSLAQKMVECADVRQAKAIIEYGPGTGSFTGAILAAKGEDARLLAIEINPVLAGEFRKRFPGVALYEDKVENVRAVCDEVGIGEVDCIISGVPWISFSKEAHNGLLDSVISVLKQSGEFVTFTYVHTLFWPVSKRFRRKLGEYFDQVSYSNVVWKNLPPAIVCHCHR